MSAVTDAKEKLELVDQLPNDRSGRQQILPLALELFRVASGTELDYKYRDDDMIELYYKGDKCAIKTFSVAADSPAAALRDIIKNTSGI